MNPLFRTTPRALAAGAAMLFLCATARAETIDIVVSGEVIPCCSGFYPNMHEANLYIFEAGIYSEIVAVSLRWDGTPVHHGDEMRVLLSFDPASFTAGPPNTWCGGETRHYGPVTGSATIAGVVAVIEPGAYFEMLVCYPVIAFTLVADVSGPSLYSDPWSPSDPGLDRFPSVEMPMYQMIVSLPSSAGGECLDADGALPQTAEGFQSSCGGFPNHFMSLWWESAPFCDLIGSCGYRAYYEFFINGGHPEAMFDVSVPTTEDYVDQLVAEVLVLNLDQGIQNSLDAKIAEAVAASDDVALATYATTTTQRQNANDSARNRLGAFINAVNAQRGKAIPDDKANRLVELAERLATRL